MANQHSRRRFCSQVLAAAAVGVVPSLPVWAQSKKIVYATWGGTWEKAIRGAWFDPFTKKTGIEVVATGGNTYGKFKAMVESGRVEWDVVEVNPDFQWIGAKDNLLEKLDFKVIDTSKVMSGQHLITPYSVPQVLWSRVRFYNTSVFKGDNRPKSWADVWDVARFPGKRTFATKANSGALEAALIADGVPMDKLYPLDVERALKSLNKIRAHILWGDTNAQLEQFMKDGQAVTGMVPDGRALAAVDNGAPVAIDYNESMMTWSTMVVPRGAPNRDGAMQFLNFAMTPEAQAAVALAYTYGPVTPDAYKAIPVDRAKILSGGPQQAGKYFFADEKWWGDNLASANEKLNAWRVG
ncbi:MAG: ABC transporter substrate-binding protein [Burkholderiales bacterium]|nr:ABC transporter substrate-binding protein [Burkholderiales bacterium]